jgi:glutamine amidotransferase
MIGIVDYQVGNVGNVMRALRTLGYKAEIIAFPQDVKKEVNGLILPGVGAFGPAMENLKQRGWADFLGSWDQENRPLLGICLGMQLLCKESRENGLHRGLGIIQGSVISLKTRKLPHMGWNTISWKDNIPPSDRFDSEGKYFYFVHSFALAGSEHAAATTKIEDREFVSIVRKNNVTGFQFHPERSGYQGLQLLGNTLEHFAGEI